MKDTSASPVGTSPTDLPGVLVSPDWLGARLEHSELRLLDLRDAESYATGHIPGAVHFDLSSIGTTLHGCESMLVGADVFESLVAERGVSNGDVIVAYDDQWGLAAARLVWAFHRYGHPAVAALDGGWDRWVDEDGRVSTEGGAVSAKRFVARENPAVFADTEWIAERIDTGAIGLLDTRSPGEFEGGHLPGAVSWDWFTSVPPGSWRISREPAELRGEWSALGLDPRDEVVVYCGSGMRAAHTYLVLRHAGFERVRLYDGSWQEWAMKMEATSEAGGDTHDD